MLDITIAKGVIILFGIFIILAGFCMLLAPKKINRILKKAGSTNLINYSEITARLFVSLALIYFSDYSRFPEAFMVFGWFMLITSLILYAIPRSLHHKFSMRSAEILKPVYFRIISPFAFLFGGLILYNVL